jgi:dihydroorotase
MVEEAAPYIRAAKYYPHGGTTNSGSGLSSPQDLDSNVLRTMEELGIVLCLHAELTPDVEPDHLKREKGFIPHLEWLVENFPQLRIVVEHVSDRRMLRKIMGMPDNVVASITAHHPFVTYCDAQHDPHCMCMPVAKTPSDREYLARMILRANDHPKIFFGSDSAPHTLADKLAGKFGAWTSPVAIPVLWQHFDSRGGSDKWDNFVAFMCTNGANFYGVGPTLERRPSMTLKRERWQVPETWPIGDHDKVDMTDPTQVLVPWKAGEVLDWRVEGMEWFGEVYED